MKKNIALEIEYDGADYCGFQIQNKKGKRERTIQQALEGALEKLFKKHIRIVYAGRTDKGVHAYAQCVRFSVSTSIPLQNIKRALNAFLPPSILIRKIRLVPSDFHPRFNAQSKIYRYVIHTSSAQSVFNRNYVWRLAKNLDITKMKRAASFLVGKRDFSCFAKEASRYKTCVRHVSGVSIRKRNAYVYIDVEADGFLYNMVRNMVSLLVAVGDGKIPPSTVPKIIKREVPYVKKPAPGCGLYLYKVKY